MRLKQQAYSLLLVSASERFDALLRPLLPASQYDPIHSVASIGAAERALLERSYDFVIINTPLPDDFGIRFAVDVSKHAVVLLLVRSDLHDEIYERVFGRGVFTLPKPTSKQMLLQALSWMATMRERLRGLEQKNLSIEEKMEEIRLINRAKWLLISELKMSEPDAHRYIEKQAMDRCISRRAVAETIIKTYS